MSGKSKVVAVLLAVVFAVVLFAGGYLTAYIRFAGVDVVSQETPLEWFGEKAAVFINPEKVDPLTVYTFNRVQYLLENKYYKELDTNLMFENAIKGMSYLEEDPFTNYYTAEEMRDYMESSTGNYVGIGITVNMDETKLLTVVGVFDGSPAREVGLQKDDKIMKVDEIDVTGRDTASEIVRMIKGALNTAVKIQVFRPSTKETLDFEIVRKEINVPNVESRLMEDSVGYIWIKQFDSDVANDFRDHYNTLIRQGMTSLVIDLRDNPGGDYYQVTQIADMILPEGLIVYTMNRDGEKSEVRSNPEHVELPIAVLVNGYSASASEILAASLQDYEAALIIGETTYGKGIVQLVDPTMPNGGGLSYTISAYYSPKGRAIHGVGVVPDITVEMPEEYQYILHVDIPEGEDVQLRRAVQELMKANQ